MNQDYVDKGDYYFANARTEIGPLLPNHAERVLEIGCGAGQTVRWLKQTNRIGRAWAMELFESAAEKARPHFEEILVGDAERLIATAFERQEFDLILCLDVLEHMVDPWRFLSTAQRLLRPGGRLIVSVPNIRCARVLLPLLWRGEWQYADHGILDRTHLRFFTRRTALALATTSELRVDRCIGFVEPNTRLATLERWTGGHLTEFTSQQFLIASTRQSGSMSGAAGEGLV